MSKSSKASGRFTISNELGLHFRAAAIVVRTAQDFKSKITIANGSAKASATSVLDLLTLAASRGTEVTVTAEGPDADKAVAALGSLIDRHFAENDAG